MARYEQISHFCKANNPRKLFCIDAAKALQHGVRKAPVQARSKERVQRILDATEVLIIESGVAGVTIHDIAARAEVAIGSLYQYFTNRDEILWALCERYYQQLDEMTGHCFKDVRTVDDFLRDVRQALEICWKFTSENPGYRSLFFDVQAWEIMREADWRDTLLNSERMSGALAPLAPGARPERLLALSVLVGDAASGTARLASRIENLREELFTEFLEMVESRVRTLTRT
jgi:AcrR family transcriptional regulator